MRQKGEILAEAEVAQFRSILYARGWGYEAPNNDHYYRTMDRAAYIATKPDGILYPIIKQAFMERRETPRQIKPPVMVSLFERALHGYALTNLDHEYYPRNFGPPHYNALPNCFDLIKAAIHSDDEYFGYGDFQQKLEMQVPISNEPERGIGLKAMALLFPERFGENPSILEPGCSLNLILKWLANDEMNRGARVEVLNSEEGTINKELSRKFNAVIAARLAIGTSLGVDIFDTYRDLTVERWGIACSVTPGEMLSQPERLARIHELTRFDPDRVHFYQADFADYLDMDNFPPTKTYRRKTARGITETKPFGVRQFDTSMSSTVEYMLDEERREAFHRHKNDYTRPDGIDFEQDFAHPQPGHPGRLEFEYDIYAKRFLYKTMFFDKQNPEAGWQVAFTWETGRCRRVVINGLAQVAIDGRPVSLKDRLMEW